MVFHLFTAIYLGAWKMSLSPEKNTSLKSFTVVHKQRGKKYHPAIKISHSIWMVGWRCDNLESVSIWKLRMKFHENIVWPKAGVWIHDATYRNISLQSASLSRWDFNSVSASKLVWFVEWTRIVFFLLFSRQAIAVLNGSKQTFQ